MSDRSISNDSVFAEFRQNLLWWSQNEGAKIEVTLSNQDECCIEGYNINDLLKNVDPYSTSNIATPTEQKEGTFITKFSSHAVKTSNQAAFQCKELIYPSTSKDNKGELAKQEND